MSNRTFLFATLVMILSSSFGSYIAAQEVFYEPFDTLDSSIWRVGTWTEHGGQLGSERCYVEDGKLNLVFINDSTEGYLSAAIESKELYSYGTWEVNLKPSSVPGVLNSFYTIDWTYGTQQEIDIEFLTYTFDDGSGEVSLAVHAADLPSWSKSVQLDFDPSSDFHTWGFQITPEYIRWFVDGTTLYTHNYADHHISITEPYTLKMNVWTQEAWINGPPEPDVEAVYQIDWLRFTPYGTVSPTPPAGIHIE
jgi:beta-glucanase (GH16 family)